MVRTRKAIYVGNQEVKKRYIGNKLIFENYGGSGENLLPQSHFEEGDGGWTPLNAGTTVKKESSLLFTASGSNQAYTFTQKSIRIEAGTYTLTLSARGSTSIDFRGGVNVSNYNTLGLELDELNYTTHSITFTVGNSNVDTLLRVYFTRNATAGKWLELDWVKLEKGSQFTGYSP